MKADPYSDRTYRALHRAGDLVYFRVTAEETDLHIGAKKSLYKEALAAVLRAREEIKAVIADRPRFLTSLEPVKPHGTETPLVASMLKAAQAASVGPMAAVAGAVSEYVGRALSAHSSSVIIENGGDVFLFSDKERLVAVHAGSSPLSGLLAVAVKPENGLGVCTSSGTFGHSLSFGRADAALIIAKDCALADAAATRFGNLIKTAGDIEPALEEIMSINGVSGALAVIGDKMGVKGEVELRALR
jgi:ApbE superfamily uncharacterized protein (UPF0280 family)